MTIYGICVIIANLVLLMKFNIHNTIGIVVFILMILAYFVFYFIVSYLFKGNIQGIFSTNFSVTIVWLTLLLTLT
jgi:hypothetical protein